jgi:hypothetical protein
MERAAVGGADPGRVVVAMTHARRVPRSRRESHDGFVGGGRAAAAAGRVLRGRAVERRGEREKGGDRPAPAVIPPSARITPNHQGAQQHHQESRPRHEP